MQNHFFLEDSEFEKQFENCTLDSELFTHEAHIRLAWIHLRKYGEQQAILNICGQLISYTASVGANDKFNKTVTVAAIKAVHHFMQKSKADTFYDFIQEFPRLIYNFRELLAFHYQVDIYNSPQAKQEYLEPDLSPFD